MKKFLSKEAMIAVTVILSLCILYIGIEYLKGINLFRPANYYYAKFEKVDGLSVSAPVTISGFQVGQVREINYDYDTNQISVLLSMNKNLRIPKQSVVKMVVDMMGTAQLVLNMANSQDYYAVGDEIPSACQAGLVDALSANVLPALGQMLPKVDSILTSLNAVLANPALNASVTRLDAITADLQASTTALNTMMRKQVPGVLGDVKATTGYLSSTMSNLNDFSQQLGDMPLQSTVENANATMANLKVLSDNLNNKNSSLGMLMNDPALYNHLDKAIASLDTLLTDLQKNPKRYVTFKVF